MAASLAEVKRRGKWDQGATRRARMAVDHDHEDHQLEDELGYAAIVVQLDRLIRDLRALPTDLTPNA